MASLCTNFIRKLLMVLFIEQDLKFIVIFSF